MQLAFEVCNEIVEDVIDATSGADRHWCIKDPGHPYMHLCSCGFRWDTEIIAAPEVPC
jgi:hypothetical protein